MNRLEEAVAVLREGIAQAPFQPVLYKSLALRYIQMQRYPEAKATLEEYVERFPEDDFIRRLLKQVSGTR
jgi:predicted Zn-dependent protease